MTCIYFQLVCYLNPIYYVILLVLKSSSFILFIFWGLNFHFVHTFSVFSFRHQYCNTCSIVYLMHEQIYDTLNECVKTKLQRQKNPSEQVYFDICVHLFHTLATQRAA